ncbi:MAG: hypothetical protein JW734_01320 [Candidatus Omnitrophica bacterium]|nr:hypothetical protein [Candidatus Omnitrophota bacterium]
MRFLLFTFIFILLCFLNCAKAEEFIQLPAVIHISSTASEGSYSFEEIAQTADKAGFKVVIFTDRDVMRWEWGMPFLRNMVKRRVEQDSIFTFGIARYIEEINKLKDKYPGMVFIAGAESAPFYYWSGSFIKGTLTMHNWHRHLLLLGLESLQDYLNIPVIGNPPALRRSFVLYKLWPLAVIILGFWFLRKPQHQYRDFRGRSFPIFSKKLRLFGMLLIAGGILFFINNWPFGESLYDQYHGDRGMLPYQNLIDYLNSKGGSIFWTHPDAEYFDEIGTIKFETKSYPECLKQAKDYTGFVVFYSGRNNITPSGVWDGILLEYCRGQRSSPVWVTGGLGFEDGDLYHELKNLKTVLLVSRQDKDSVTQALRQGRMYVAKGKRSYDFILDKFYVCDETRSARGFMGGTVKVKDLALLHIEAESLGLDQKVEVSVIKNGKVVKTSKVETPFLISYFDRNIAQGKSYYRLEIKAEGLHLVTNPIFVKR